MIRNLSLVLLLAFATSSFANEIVTDSRIDARLRQLSTELRCLVCQNSTLADSDAPLAQDLRREIRKLMEAGKTDEEIVAYLVERYGDFVTFRPPVNASTALLWFGPFIMLIIGAITLVIVLKKRAAILTSEENAS
ncbi:MAG: cytochrome c-type biogenesis protein CcmH [Methylophilaceae bacterium]|jgi:cytochrome c-type biogenesis protein CcmH|tara:strand:+ start:3431 stop:3838 length:408 start_codon:yes stop_codon:yes gene_type:complete